MSWGKPNAPPATSPNNTESIRQLLTPCGEAGTSVSPASASSSKRAALVFICSGQFSCATRSNRVAASIYSTSVAVSLSSSQPCHSRTQSCRNICVTCCASPYFDSNTPYTTSFASKIASGGQDRMSGLAPPPCIRLGRIRHLFPCGCLRWCCARRCVRITSAEAGCLSATYNPNPR